MKINFNYIYVVILSAVLSSQLYLIYKKKKLNKPMHILMFIVTFVSSYVIYIHTLLDVNQKNMEKLYLKYVTVAMNSALFLGSLMIPHKRISATCSILWSWNITLTYGLLYDTYKDHINIFRIKFVSMFLRKRQYNLKFDSLQMRSIPLRFLKSIPNINHISLINCGIETIPKNITGLNELTKLELDYNLISKLPDKINLPKLEYLDLRGNNLIFSNVKGLDRLKLLVISDSSNNFVSKSNSNFRIINTLGTSMDLSSMKKDILKIMLRKSVSTTTSLSLANNNLRNIPRCVNNFTSLKSLNLKNNNITEFNGIQNNRVDTLLSLIHI